LLWAYRQAEEFHSDSAHPIALGRSARLTEEH
jgi:hypothetical protein